MKQKALYIRILGVLILGLSIAHPVFVRGSDNGMHDKNVHGHKGTSPETQQSAGRPPLLLNYRPPMRGKPGNRVGGGTRGGHGDTPFLAALVPDHTGLTILPQPVLYWYISLQAEGNMEFTLIDENGIEPLVETGLPKPDHQGIQCVSISDFNTFLVQGRVYQWFIAVVSDPCRRSRDVVAGGSIQRIDPPHKLINRLKGAKEAELPGIYAEEGIWYDALASISELIRTDPLNEGLREQRYHLLEQAGLHGVVTMCERDTGT